MTGAATRVAADRKTLVLEEIAQDWRSFAEECGVEFPDAKDVGLCPFHDDTDPSLSFFVNEENGERWWKCRGACDAQGNLIDLFMRRHGIPFREALH